MTKITFKPMLLLPLGQLKSQEGFLEWHMPAAISLVMSNGEFESCHTAMESSLKRPLSFIIYIIFTEENGICTSFSKGCMQLLYSMSGKTEMNDYHLCKRKTLLSPTITYSCLNLPIFPSRNSVLRKNRLS